MNAPLSPNLPSVLPLPEEDEYGGRPEVHRAVLEQFLQLTGLPKVLPHDENKVLPELVATMREIATSECSGLAMFSVLG